MADALLGGLVINEILADPTGATANFDTDNSGTARGRDEFVELYNNSATAIDISGLELWDAGRGNWFTFPSGTILQAGGHAMVITRVQGGGSLPTGGPDDLFFNAGFNRNVLNNTKDNVVVYDPANDEFIQALYNGDSLDDPPNDYSGFSATATRNGAGEDFGSDIDGFSMQRSPDGSDTFVNNQTPTPGTTNVCFTTGTQLKTPKGPVTIEELSAGDMLCTRDHGPQAIRWIWSKTIEARAIKSNPALNGIVIRPNALGDGQPGRIITVSRHHRVLVSSKIAKRMFGAPEILVPAKDLLGLHGVECAPLGHPITYFHILMANHEILIADGMATESLYLGKDAKLALGLAALAEMRLVFGDETPSVNTASVRPARRLASGKRVQNLVLRHLKNQKPLQLAS